MKIIKYKLLNEVNLGTDETPNFIRSFHDVIIPYSEEGEIRAKNEAYNGEYSIEDDGQPEPELSREEKLEARVKALTETNAMLEECIVEMAAVVYA